MLVYQRVVQPPHPKFNVELRCAPMDQITNPQKSILLTQGFFLRVETLRFGVGDSTKSNKEPVAVFFLKIFCPSTVVQMGVSAMWLYWFPLKRSFITGFWGTQNSNKPDTE